MMRSGSVRGLAKLCAYRSGLLGAWHRWRNRRSLTVAIFHRVLPGDHPAWSYSDSAWVVSEAAFRECLRFFRRHYTVVALEDLLGNAPAPPCPLLITFDDGWSDTAEYALPLLREEGLPAAVFVVSDAVGKHEMRQEAAIRERRQKGGGAGAPAKPEMLTAASLRALRDAGVAIGSHGFTHTPIPQASDPVRELRSSRTALAAMLDDASHPGLRTFAFPHGLYDRRAMAMAAEAGYRLLFTSDERLNPIPRGKSAPVVLGRINIPFSIIADAAGRFHPEFLACWLFLRPRRS